MMERECTKCERVLPVDQFHRHASCKGGYNSVCKECRKPVSKKQYQEQSQEYRIWKRAQSRAKKKGLVFNLDISDITIPDLCPVLHVLLEVGDYDYTPSIDRIDPKQGYVKGNVRIISNRANVLKNSATREELELILKDCEIT